VDYDNQILVFTQAKKYGPVPAGKHRKSMEHGSSIPTGSFRIFSDEFRSFPGEG
jgi:hypothetical protein